MRTSSASPPPTAIGTRSDERRPSLRGSARGRLRAPPPARPGRTRPRGSRPRRAGAGSPRATATVPGTSGSSAGSLQMSSSSVAPAAPEHRHVRAEGRPGLAADRRATRSPGCRCGSAATPAGSGRARRATRARASYSRARSSAWPAEVGRDARDRVGVLHRRRPDRRTGSSSSPRRPLRHAAARRGRPARRASARRRPGTRSRTSHGRGRGSASPCSRGARDRRARREREAEARRVRLQADALRVDDDEVVAVDQPERPAARAEQAGSLARSARARRRTA